MLRAYCYPQPWRDVMLWVDVLSTVPLVIRVIVIAGDDAGLLSYYLHREKEVWGKLFFLLVAASSFRFLKMTRYLLGMKILNETIRNAATALVIPMYLIIMTLTFFGTLIFAVEYNPKDTENGARVTDIPTSWWMTLVTMSISAWIRTAVLHVPVDRP
eukprot:3933994-Prymnesium_polylepis.2